MNQGSGLGTQAHTSDRNADRQQTILNIERDIGAILRWENPARSGVLLVLLVGSIVVTRHYSLIQIFAGLLTVAIAVNFAYVTIVVQGRRVLLDSKSSHPYGNVIQDQSLHVDYRSVHLFSSLFVDLAETMIRGLSKIILIENNTASLKWLVIFYLTWTLSAYVSSMTIVLTFIISAFLIPRLYMSNKDVVNHHLQRGEHLIKTHLERTQNLATESVNDAYSKTRAYVSQIGTTGTDAANTLNKESLSLKQD
ncbi:Reticulon-domain-containing protein [Spinellus fusiger]|nr:Reticulon-domain-containing protein [Spinellus fusiger]